MVIKINMNIQRIRKIKKYGNSYIIKLEKADIIDFQLKEGDDIIIDDIIKIQK